ncbi:WD domain, G-beta repeat protein [Aphelenchoides besseyi]|nr:WD domain, G-beta repeat protein [Aphelenchoides besseyi]
MFKQFGEVMENSYSVFGSSVEHRIKQLRETFQQFRIEIPALCSRKEPQKRTVHVPSKHPCHLNTVATVDANTILTGGQDGTIRSYDFTDASILQEYVEHSDQVTKIDYSLRSGQRMFLSGSVDETIRLFDLSKPKSLQTFTKPGISVEGLSFLNEHSFVSAGFLSGLLMWNMETGQTTAGARADDHFITSMALIPEADMVLTSGIDGTLRYWDLRLMDVVATCDAGQFPLTNCEVSFNATECIVLEDVMNANEYENLCAVQMWDLRQQSLMDRFHGHNQPAVSAMFLSSQLSKDQIFMSVGDDQRIVVWNCEDNDLPIAVEILTDVPGNPCIGAVSKLGNNRFAIVGQNALVSSIEISIDTDNPKIFIATMESQYHDEVNEQWQKKLEALGFV